MVIVQKLKIRGLHNFSLWHLAKLKQNSHDADMREWLYIFGHVTQNGTFPVTLLVQGMERDSRRKK